MANVFISYSRRDRPFARQLADALSKSQFRVWIDERLIRAGVNFVTEIETAIKQSDYFILIDSFNSKRSSWVDKEVSCALNAITPPSPLKIIPVKVDESGPRKELAELNHIDFTGDFATAVSQLVNDIRRIHLRRMWHFQDHYVIVARQGREFRNEVPHAAQVASFCGRGYSRTFLFETVGDGELCAGCTQEAIEYIKFIITDPPEAWHEMVAERGYIASIVHLLNRLVVQYWTDRRGKTLPRIGGRMGILFQDHNQAGFFGLGAVSAYAVNKGDKEPEKSYLELGRTRLFPDDSFEFALRPSALWPPALGAPIGHMKAYSNNAYNGVRFSDELDFIMMINADFGGVPTDEFLRIPVGQKPPIEVFERLIRVVSEHEALARREQRELLATLLAIGPSEAFNYLK